jgi:hypothetical protein
VRQRKGEEETEWNKEREEGDIRRDRCETEKEGGRNKGEQRERRRRHWGRMGDRERGRKRQRGTKR